MQAGEPRERESVRKPRERESICSPLPDLKGILSRSMRLATLGVNTLCMTSGKRIVCMRFVESCSRIFCAQGYVKRIRPCQDRRRRLLRAHKRKRKNMVLFATGLQRE